jgi:ABC transport system ATP-binding/permease protein
MAATPPIAVLKGVRLTLGGAPLFTGVDLSLSRGERMALVGRNGAGKSTLMRILSHETEPDGGEVFLQPGVSVMRLAQEPDLSGYPTALDFVAIGLDQTTRFRAEAELDEWDVPRDLDPVKASGGQARRIALAAAFAQDPDILLLDEPTNHLDVAAIEALEKRLTSFRGAILTVSHDRRFLETITTSVAWLRQGVVRQLDKGYAAYEDWAADVEDAEEAALSKLNTQLKAEERWLARGVTARRRRNMGRVRKLLDMRAEKRQRKVALGEAASGANLAIDTGAQSGRLVIEAKGLSKTFETREGPLEIARNFNLRVMRGDRVGFVGPNGSGKTTLLRMLLGQMPPDAGTVRLSKSAEVAFLDQSRASLKPDETLWDTLAPLGGDQVMVRGYPKHVAAYAKDFLFDSRQLRQPVGALSGGERNRLTLALALAKPSNLLVLDEPTNDLDIETLDLLEEMLADYDGTILLVSHDRAFLDGVVTSVLTPEGNGKWLETPGGYSDYLAQRKSASTKTTETTAAKSISAPSAPRAASKLGYKDQRRLEEFDRLMPERQAEIIALEAAMADPDLFSRQPAEFQKKAARLAAARVELEGYELEWLALEEKRDALARER